MKTILASLGLVGLSGAYGLALTSGHSMMVAGTQLPESPAVVTAQIHPAAYQATVPDRPVKATPAELPPDRSEFAHRSRAPEATGPLAHSPRPLSRAQGMTVNVARSTDSPRQPVTPDSVTVTSDLSDFGKIAASEPGFLGRDRVERTLVAQSSMSARVAADDVVPDYMHGVYR